MGLAEDAAGALSSAHDSVHPDFLAQFVEELVSAKTFVHAAGNKFADAYEGRLDQLAAAAGELINMSVGVREDMKISVGTLLNSSGG